MLPGTDAPARQPRPQRRAPGGNRIFWAALAAPGIIWLAVLFIVPFYAILAIAFGRLNQVFGYPVAIWNPLQWSSANFSSAMRDVVGGTAFVGPIIIRTLVYVAAASLLSLLIAYPAAYFVARYVNKVLTSLHLISQPVNWLGGLGPTVVLGLVYGYIPYLILVLYAGLDRIDPALIEAGRDLGLGRARTFLRVTLPLSRQPIMTGMLITVLPMLGDYFTNQLMSGTTGTTMLGNVIDEQLNTPGLQGEGAVFSMLFLLALVIPMIYYVVATNRASRTAT